MAIVATGDGVLASIVHACVEDHQPASTTSPN
jgi:hypothetical protein